MAAWVPDMFCDFYLAKNHKIVNNSTTTEAGEKISKDLESLECWKFFDVGLAKFESNQRVPAIKFYLIKLATEY